MEERKGQHLGQSFMTTDLGVKGILIKQFGERDERGVLRYWDDVSEQYKEKGVYIPHLIRIKTINKTAFTDEGFYSVLFEASIEAALISHDKNWFEEAAKELKAWDFI